MSTETPMPETDSLDEYRAALLARDGVSADEYQARLTAAEQAIFADCGSEEAGWKVIDAIQRDVDHDGEVDEWRENLQTALTDAEKATSAVGAAIGNLAGDRLYDVEIAEGNTAAMNAALTGIKLNLAALRHLTRHALPTSDGAS